ncbi:MAG TPA: hypothetical protein PLX35_03410 [Cyclobacteriaceae bacterium]|nr:hypothetical protein [Cyclobacteriaceae bacterium]
MTLRTSGVLLVFCCLVFDAQAQFPKSLRDGLKTYLTPDSSAFIKLNFTSQIWVRSNDNNPGTTVNGQPESNTFDVGLRRTRLVLSGQLTDRVFFFLQFGQNNIGYLSPRKVGTFFHDVVGEYAIVKKKLNFGVGLHGWNGPGRFSNSSISTLLLLDPPVFQETTNDANDQFVRKMGVYAKGKLGRFDYRFSVSKPFVTQTASIPIDPLGTNSSYSTMIPQLAYQGYFMVQLKDIEGNAGPGTVGSYLGKKKVFNVGFGFVNQSKAMWNKTAANDTVYHAMNLWAVDVYYDAPLNSTKGIAISIYGGYFHYDFGPGYLRNVGPMNPANGVKNGTLNGAGNAAPIIGTGPSLFLQSGYKFRDRLLGDQGTLQIYAAVQHANFDRLSDPMTLIDCGVNWLINGHNSKFTLNYQSRPVFAASDSKLQTRRGEWVLQYQIAF